MTTHDINLPPLRRPQVPRIDADIDLADERRLVDWCEKTARSYARAAIRAPRKQNDRMLAHEWIRPALGLSEDAPYRFDFYAQQIEGMKADRKRRGVSSTHTLDEPVGYVMPTGIKQLKAGGNAIVSGVNQGWDVPVYTAPQPAESFKSRRIDDAVRGLQASVAVGSDGEWVSIRREARDAAVKRLQELNSDCAHLYESYVEAVKKSAPQPAEPSIKKQINDEWAEKMASKAEPVKRKRPYAQGTALGEFGVIPMRDQFDDEPSGAPTRHNNDSGAQNGNQTPQPAESACPECGGDGAGGDHEDDCECRGEAMSQPSGISGELLDVLLDALSNLERDNYERSYSGSQDREADSALIRAALAAFTQQERS